MNKERRKAIADAIGLLDTAMSDINTIAAEEQDAFDNLPESIQMGERGDLSQEAITNLEYAASTIEDAIEQLNAASE